MVFVCDLKSQPMFTSKDESLWIGVYTAYHCMARVAFPETGVPVWEMFCMFCLVIILCSGILLAW